MTVMLYMSLLLPTGQGVANHCTCHLPLPLMAWSMDPNRHSGQRLVTKAVCHSVPPASKQQDGLMDAVPGSLAVQRYSKAQQLSRFAVLPVG